MSDTLLEEDKYILAQFEKMACRMTEIQSMMKNGEFIVAYEKLGGVQKIILTTGGILQQRMRKSEVVTK